jgi:hypothetical protein
MQKNYTFLLLLFSIINVNAQLEIVYGGTNADTPFDLLLDGTTMYYSEDSRISKFDVTDTAPIPLRTTVISDLNRASGMAIKEDTLYFSNFFEQAIFKIDVTQSDPTAIGVTGSGIPNKLLLIETNLYHTDTGSGRLYVRDLLLSNPSSDVVTVGFANNDGPIGIDLRGNDLYITTTTLSGEGKLYRVNIDNPIPEVILTGLQRPLGLTFRGDDLYIAQEDGDNIVKVDITQDPLVTQEVIAVNSPRDVEFYNDIMYIATVDWIYKVDLNALDIEEFEEPNLKLYPNPAQDFIKVANIKEEKGYKLFDINGRELKSGNINSTNNKINVSDLSYGTYIVYIDNSSHKFIKM